MNLRVAFLLPFLGVLGCNDQPTGLPLDVPTITPARQWSGGTITMQGELFKSGPSRFTVRGDDSVLTWRRVDDSTIAVTLPAVSSGAMTLTYESSRGDAILGIVEVAGFLSTTITDREIFAPLDRWPDQAGQLILGPILINGGLGFAPGILNPETGHVASDTSLSIAIPLLPGLSYQAGITFVPRDPNVTEVWRLHPTQSLLDSLPFRGGYRLFQLDEHIFVSAGNNNDVFSARLIRPDSGVTWTMSFEDFRAPTHLYFSPQGDRAAAGVGPSAGLMKPEIPVFDMATGDIAYGITAVFTLGAASFSPDGSLLYITGSTSQGRTDSSLVLVVNASDGSFVQEFSIPGRAVGMALDAGTRLFIPAVGEDCRLRLAVLNAATLGIEAWLQVPPAEDPCDTEFEMATLISRAGSSPTVYVVKGTGFLQPARIYRFDLID